MSVVKGWGGVELCLPCYVDVLEVRQARGVMVDRRPELEGEADRQPSAPGNSPSPSPSLFRQLDLFDA